MTTAPTTEPARRRPAWVPATGIVGLFVFFAARFILHGPWSVLDTILAGNGLEVTVRISGSPTAVPAALPEALADAIDFAASPSPVTGRLTSLSPTALTAVAASEALLIVLIIASAIALYRLMVAEPLQLPDPWEVLLARSRALRRLLLATAAAYALEAVTSGLVLRAAVPDEVDAIWLEQGHSAPTFSTAPLDDQGFLLALVLGWTLSYLVGALHRLHEHSLTVDEENTELREATEGLV